MLRHIPKLVLVFLPIIAFGEEGNAWLEEVSKRIDPEAVQWVRQQLKEQLEINSTSQSKVGQIGRHEELKGKRQCVTTITPVSEQPKLFVFMSLSVPESTWIELSKEVTKENGVFVLRGLPGNSFRALAVRMARLKERGVDATIQLHPMLFKDYSVEKVPTFVVVNEQGFDKVSGNISLAFALEQIASKGEITKSEMRREGWTP